jgi:hypothetical protein
MTAQKETVSAQTTAAVCQDCGMPLTGWAERHPIDACEMFRRTRDADTVRKAFEVKELDA